MCQKHALKYNLQKFKATVRTKILAAVQEGERITIQCTWHRGSNVNSTHKFLFQSTELNKALRIVKRKTGITGTESNPTSIPVFVLKISYGSSTLLIGPCLPNRKTLSFSRLLEDTNARKEDFFTQ